MPLYDVKCNKCNKTFELDIPLADFDSFKEGECIVLCHDPDAEVASCDSKDKVIIITGLKTKHKSWWNWRDITK